MSLSDPEVVRAQYATETGLETRRSIYSNREGDDARVRSRTRRAEHPGGDNADRVPDGVGPVRVGIRVTVFVAQRR